MIKTHKAKLARKALGIPVTISVDDSARLREMRQFVTINNRSSLDENLIICQIYMESRFDARAKAAGSTAKGLMQLTVDAVSQVFQYRTEKSLGHKIWDRAALDACKTEGRTLHASDAIYDDATNIQLGTEYMQYWVDTTKTLEDAYIKYRGVSNGIYYRKIKSASEKLQASPESMQVLRDMVIQ